MGEVRESASAVYRLFQAGDDFHAPLASLRDFGGGRHGSSTGPAPGIISSPAMRA